MKKPKPRFETDQRLVRHEVTPEEVAKMTDTSHLPSPDEIMSEYKKRKKKKPVPKMEVPAVGHVDKPEKSTTKIYIPDLSALRAALPPDTLDDLNAECTAKQRDFALLVAHGVPAWSAYENVYDVGENTKQATKYNAGRRILRSNTVTWAITKIRRASATAALLDGKARHMDAPDVVREWILSRMSREAADEKNNTGAVRVRALELMGKAYGVFKGKAPDEYEENDGLEEADGKLVQLLEKARRLSSVDRARREADGEVILDADATIVSPEGEEPDD